jgi:hypothetical protein
MRPTVDLDDDVVVLRERALAQRQTSLKEVVNAALRIGLVKLSEPKMPEPVRGS